MPTKLPRIQVTIDAELAEAFERAASRLPAGLSRSAQFRAMALAGARVMALPDESERLAALAIHAAQYDDPEAMGVDWGLLGEVKHRAWRTW